MDCLRGSEIERARCRLGLSKTELAQLMGVGPSAVYRWENAANVRIDPFHFRLAKIVIEASQSPQAADAGYELREALRIDAMRALYVLLGQHFGGI